MLKELKENFKERHPMEPLNFNEPLLDRKSAALFLNMKPSTLAVWDCTKRYDLKPIKVGGRVRYSKANLIKFLNDQHQEK